MFCCTSKQACCFHSCQSSHTPDAFWLRQHFNHYRDCGGWPSCSTGCYHTCCHQDTVVLLYCSTFQSGIHRVAPPRYLLVGEYLPITEEKTSLHVCFPALVCPTMVHQNSMSIRAKLKSRNSVLQTSRPCCLIVGKTHSS